MRNISFVSSPVPSILSNLMALSPFGAATIYEADYICLISTPAVVISA